MVPSVRNDLMKSLEISKAVRQRHGVRCKTKNHAQSCSNSSRVNTVMKIALAAGALMQSLCVVPVCVTLPWSVLFTSFFRSALQVAALSSNVLATLIMAHMLCQKV